MAKSLLALTAAFFLLTAAVSSAAELTLAVTPQEKTVVTGEGTEMAVKIASTLKTGGIYLYVTGGPSNSINLGSSFITLPIKEVEVPLVFYPNDITGTYTYNVLAQSSAHPELTAEQEVKLVVLGPANMNMIDGGITKEGDNAKVSMVLQAGETERAVIEFTLTDKEGRTGATYTFTEEITGREEVSLSIPLSSVVAGDYTAKAIVKGTQISVSSQMHVEPIRMVVKTLKEENLPFSNEHTIGIANDGNVVEEGYVVEANVPTGFVTFSVPPEKCEDGVCEWIIPSIRPKDALEIVYRVEYWPLVAEGLVIAVLISVFVVFGWNRVNMPSISKRVEAGRSGNYTAVIEIRNAGRKLVDVSVKDFVTPLFRVDGSFETSVKPEMKHRLEGTELMWNISVLGPGEHRIIHYRMKPVINGHLRVSKATMRYSLSNGVKGRIQSGESFVAA